MSEFSETSKLNEILQALAHPATRYFIELVYFSPRPIGDICRHFDVPQERVSAFALKLKKLGFIREWNGAYFYDDKALSSLRSWLAVIEVRRRREASRRWML